MGYSLNTTIINLSDKQKPDNAVILCHGYGGDGNDISIIGKIIFQKLFSYVQMHQKNVQ